MNADGGRYDDADDLGAAVETTGDEGDGRLRPRAPSMRSVTSSAKKSRAVRCSWETRLNSTFNVPRFAWTFEIAEVN